MSADEKAKTPEMDVVVADTAVVVKLRLSALMWVKKSNLNN